MAGEHEGLDWRSTVADVTAALGNAARHLLAQDVVAERQQNVTHGQQLLRQAEPISAELSPVPVGQQQLRQAEPISAQLSRAPGEVAPPAHLHPMSGAYYRKVASSFDPQWRGISTLVTLGVPTSDPHRIKSHNSKHADGFSIYLGGRAGRQEIDAGLTWEVVKDAHGKVSAQPQAWRPFWRNDKWHNAPAQANYYWRPGEQVIMSVQYVRDGVLRLDVRDPGDKPQRHFSTEFAAPGFTQENAKSFKRVAAIDQEGREGRSVKPTKSQLVDVNFQRTVLQRANRGVIERYLLTPQRSAALSTPADHITVKTDATTGGEAIDIRGRKSSRK